ncbi:Uncharacterised protein [Pasteurella bettyae]|nr:Uncharacterised protein [Pasteurella bettyae]
MEPPFLKLSLLKSVNSLLSPEITLTEGAIYLNLHFDKALRTKKQIFALTLIKQSSHIHTSIIIKFKKYE